MSSPTAASCSVPILDLKAQYRSIREEIQAALDRVLDSQVFVLGPEVQALEAEIARYCGTKFAVGVASGTDALILAMSCCGVGPGDEVVVPSFTFIATADAVSLLGATPVFADIQAGTFTLDPTSVVKKLSPRTRAVVPVHLFGQPCDMKPLTAIAREHGLQVIEDNAQALGAEYAGVKTGGIGDLGCISFFPSKNLGGYGDGGMILTNSEEQWHRLKSLRSHGSRKKYFSEEQGWNSRLDEIQAAVLRVKLRYLDRWNLARQANASLYTEMLTRVPEVQPPTCADWGSHVFHQYTVRVPQRDRVHSRLGEMGISTAVYYPVPIHLQPIYSHLRSSASDLQETERAADEVLSLPMYPELTQPQIEYVSDSVMKAIAS